MTIKAEASNRKVITMTTLSFKWLIDSICPFHRHNRHIHLNSNRWNRYSHQVISQSSKNLYTGMLTTTDPLLYTKTKKSLLRRNSNHLEIIILTTSSAASDENFNKTKTLTRQCAVKPIICKHVVEITWRLIVYMFIPKFQALNLKYIFYFQQFFFLKEVPCVHLTDCLSLSYGH